ncbi:uncharacterized protein G2W53_033364 [Senna tora]|uniref:Uncharacterized protein n=1 Tax=Senna tora TaxID=362788 RepID=A0A834W8E8_9FABA|nr:uncharacterized protein G2W53_033364 [Senna tora]
MVTNKGRKRNEVPFRANRSKRRRWKINFDACVCRRCSKHQWCSSATTSSARFSGKDCETHGKNTSLTWMEEQQPRTNGDEEQMKNKSRNAIVGGSL